MTEMAVKIISLILMSLVAAVLLSRTAQSEPTSEVILRSEIKFQPLNPARGDASPKAGVLWGDIKKNVPSGVLLKFADGFSSPPHIHNITYRAVVISGAIHNDDPKAEKMWMGPGSFWTQPAGESHITAAANGGATAFLEILAGPYLVRPTNRAFDNGQRPVNIDTSNIVWLDASDTTWIAQSGTPTRNNGPKMAFLWGKPKEGQLNASLVQLPAGYTGQLRTKSARLRAVVIKGDISHQTAGKAGVNKLETGSYFGSTGEMVHQVSCGAENDCVLYMSMRGTFELAPS